MNYQESVNEFMQVCFGPEISANKRERNFRFLEESIELAQACGTTKEEALLLVDCVFNRPLGEPIQEVGGVMVTLAALCNAHEIGMESAGEKELNRVYTIIDKIRAKWKAKQIKDGPLPGNLNI